MKITTFTKNSGIATKTIQLENGKPKSDGSSCMMAHGTAITIDISMADLARLIDACDDRTAICVGALKNSKEAKVVTKSKLRPGTIARTREFLEFTPEQPGALVLDYDQKGMPPGLGGKFWDAMTYEFPMLADANCVSRTSTSAGLYRSDTNEPFNDSGGLHVYVEVLDSADIPRALDVCFKRLWLAGYGWIVVSAAGQLLVRSLVDASVGQPERLFFEGPPQLTPPLAQKRPPAVYHPGQAICSRACFPDLTAAEHAHFQELVSAAKIDKMPEALDKRDRACRVEAKLVAKRTGRAFDSVLNSIKQRYDWRLTADTTLYFDEIDPATVADVLADPERYVDLTLADPIEPDYGRCKAQILRGKRQLIIHSFAHGSHVFELLYDESTLRKRIEGMPKDLSAADEFIACLGSCEDPIGIFERLKKDVATHTGVGVQALNAKRKEYARRNRKKEEKTDPRHQLECPGRGAEKLSALKPIDDHLSKVTSTRPPLRNLSGDLVRVEERSVATLHELVSESVGEKLRSSGEDVPPAPRDLLFKKLSATGVSMLVEEYIGIYSYDEDGNKRYVSLPHEFSQAFMEMPGSKIPVCTSIQTLPLVLPDGSVLSSDGYDPERRLLMQNGCPGVISSPDEDPRAAYKFLCDEWLCDVQTDDEGRALIITTLLQMIERPLLDQRPIIAISGSMSGGGKTTLANMLSVAVTGHRAPAAAWSSREEELEKSILSYLIEGVPLIVFDNMLRGTQINSPTLDKISTSPEYTGRLLGSTKTGIASACSTIILTGNCISPRGDTRNRMLVIPILSETAKPESRSFKHEDIIGCTMANRPKILRALYTIAMARRVAGAATTRFKTWYRLCAEPVEMITGVDINSLFARNDDVDDETIAVSLLINTFHEIFKGEWFKARDIATLMNEMYYPSTTDSGAVVAYHQQFGSSWDDQARALRLALDTVVGGAALPSPTPDPIRVGHKLRAMHGYVVDAPQGSLRFFMQTNRKDGARYRIVLQK
jgi:hypothetical protein